MSRCMCARSLVMTAAMTRSAAPLAKRARAIRSIIRPGGPFGHPDRDRPAADDLHVAALQGGLPEVLDVEPLVVAELRIPVVERLIAEPRMRAIDGGHVVGLAPTGGPEHRIDRDAAVDPARRVAGEQGVGEGRQDEHRRVVDGGPDERVPRSLPRSSPDSSTVRPPMRWRASASGASAARDAWTSSTRLGPTTASAATTSMIRSPGVIARGQCLAKQVLDVEDLDAALAHTGHELVVLPLGALDPEHVVEEQLVVVGRREASRHSSGRWTITWRSLPTSEWTPNVRHPNPLASRRRRDHLSRPSRRPAASIPSSEPIAARLPVASTNSAAAATLGPIEPAGKSIASSSAGRRPVDPGLRRLAPVGVDPVDVGRHHEEVRVELAGEQARWRGPCRSPPRRRATAARAPGVDIVGMPPPPAQITTAPWSSSQRIGRISKMRLGRGEGTTRRQ